MSEACRMSIVVASPYRESTSRPAPHVTRVSTLAPKGEQRDARRPQALDGLISSGPGRPPSKMRAAIMRIRAGVTAGLVAVTLAACATAPEGTYFATPSNPGTARMAQILSRAAVAGGDDPQRYGFALIKSPTAAAYSDEDAVFYFTDGLMRQPTPVIEAVVAHEVAHEVLGHVGTRRKLSLSLTASFGALGLFAPGAGLLDFVVNPLVVRAFGRYQEMQA